MATALALCVVSCGKTTPTAEPQSTASAGINPTGEDAATMQRRVAEEDALRGTQGPSPTPDSALTPEAETVDPARLMALPKDYEDRRVQFAARVSGGLQPEGSGRSRAYIDDYSHLTPILQGSVLRKWLESGFMSGRVYSVTFVGRVRTKSYGSFVDFEVEDFSRD